VPCSNSMRSFCSLVDILGDVRAVQVECQGEPSHDNSRMVDKWEVKRAFTREQSPRSDRGKLSDLGENFRQRLRNRHLEEPGRLWMNDGLAAR